MLAKRFRENSRSFRCGFKVKGHGHGEENGWNPMAKLYFGEENIRTVFKLYSLNAGYDDHKKKQNRDFDFAHY